MRVAFGSDHAGLDLKRELIRLAREAGHEVEDFGTDSAASCDYPDFARMVAERVAGGEFERGVLICGTGLGMAITANKVSGVRAVVVSEPFSARMSREHNDANILCLGQRVVGIGLAGEILDVWLQTDFAGGRHAQRLFKIRQLEEAGSGGGNA